jgi:hypothetical protein
MGVGVVAGRAGFARGGRPGGPGNVVAMTG